MEGVHVLGDGEHGVADMAGGRDAVDQGNVAMVGRLELDMREREHAREWNLRVLTMREIDERGVRSVMEEAIAVASSRS